MAMTNEEEIRRLRSKLAEDATFRQRQAAAPELSIWVNASAGTGKTKVLTDRVLQLLLAGISAGKLLCLTYTKAAAVEMSSRVSKELSTWAVADDQTLEKELIKLFGRLPENERPKEELKTRARKLFAVMLDTPGGIKIQTIHSFCQEILKRFPLEAGISPHFEVMDDRTGREAFEEIKNLLIDEIHNHPDSETAKAMAFLTANTSEKNFPKIINNIISARSKISRLSGNGKNIDGLIVQQAEKLGINPEKSEREIINAFFEKLPQEDLRLLLETWLAGSSSFASRAEKLATVLQNPENRDFDTYCGAFIGSDGEKYKKAAPKAAITTNPRLQQIFSDELSRILELKETLKAWHVFSFTKAVDILAGELIKGYERYKQNRALMDYNDMILLTRRLLDNHDAARWVLYKLDGGIDSILIDEAQDTSPDQWEIIRAVSDEFFTDSNSRRTIFAVGDRKQSIYSFQGADPDKFDEMSRHFHDKTSKFKQIDLQVSFRSAPAVLEAVNTLFEIPEVSAGVISPGEKIHHIPSRQGECGVVELWPLLEPEEEENNNEWLPPVEHKTAPTTSLRMAREIAQRIRKLVAGREMLVSQNRPLRYSDFLILVRSRDTFCEELIRECKKAGVKIAGIDRIRLLEQIAVQDLISLGKFLLLPEDDLCLAEVLKSPLFGLNDDDLFTLCYERRCSLWKRLERCSEYAETAKILKHLLNTADYIRPFELYSEVLNVFNGRRLYAERMGSEAEDGLDEFLNLALVFEQNHTASLQKFIEWFENDDVEIKREAESGKSDMVRLMTVHGSKGLQAPIVILPDTTRIPQCKREAGLLWEDDEIFLYPSCAADYEKICNRLKENQKQKMLEEYRRLLYVALTRAEDRLIVCGYRKSHKPAENCWYNLFTKSFEQISEESPEKDFRLLVSPQLLPFDENEKTKEEKTVFTPAVWMTSTPPEETLFSRPYTPSRPEEEEPAVISPLSAASSSHLFKRGALIHRLLQFLPTVADDKRKILAQNFIARNNPELPKEEREKITGEVISLLNNPQFGSVFGPGSKAEVPVMGLASGKIISGQIDRLIIEPKRVVIVDFKTNRPAAKTPSQVPEIYRRQLAAYRSLLAEIYPDKEIISLILWTNTAKLMLIE